MVEIEIFHNGKKHDNSGKPDNVKYIVSMIK